MVPCAFCGQNILPILPEDTPRKAPLWVDRKMHSHFGLAAFGTPFVYEINALPVWVDRKTQTMLGSHIALNGSMASPPWSVLICHTDRLSKSIPQPYGPTVKPKQCYGAIQTSVAPWLRHLGLA